MSAALESTGTMAASGQVRHFGVADDSAKARVGGGSSSLEALVIDIAEDFPTEDALGWSAARLAIQQILSLEQDWDDAGAEPISIDVISTCCRFLDHLQRNHVHPPDRVVPSPDGSVFFAWVKFGGVIEAEIETRGLAEFSIPDGRGGHSHMAIQVSV